MGQDVDARQAARAHLSCMRSLSLLAALHLAACAGPDPEVARLCSQVDQDSLYAHVTALATMGSRYHHVESRFGHAKSRSMLPGTALTGAVQQQKIAYIEQQLQAHGYSTWREDFDQDRRLDRNWGVILNGVNIFAEKRGVAHPERVLELGAHYDVASETRGAGDNCTGVAAVLEIARVLSAVQTASTVRFCLFDLEEVGAHGGWHHVQAMLDGKVPAAECIFVFDAIGYAAEEPDAQRGTQEMPQTLRAPAGGGSLAILGDIWSGGYGAAYETAADKYAPDLRYVSGSKLAGFVGHAEASGHGPYWAVGMKGILLTESTGWRRQMNRRGTPDSMEPQPKQLDMGYLRLVSQAALGTTLEICGQASQD